MAKGTDICNPKCLVNFLYWEVNNKMLPCKNCPLSEKCNEYQTAKAFIITN